MVTLHISEQLANKLDSLASKTQQPIEDVIEHAIAKYSELLQSAPEDTQQAWVYDPSKDPMLLLAQAAAELNQRSGRSDISQWTSAEIADQYAQHLMDSLEAGSQDE